MAYLISGCLMFVLGAVAASCYWWVFFKARDEGYRRGYSQAQYEESIKECAVTEAAPTLFGKAVNWLGDD